MPISTAGTTLMYKVASEYVKLCDITSYPDLGSAPSKLDTTDLSATKMKTNIFGLQEAPDLAFESNYDKTAYTLLKGVEGATHDFQLQFGEDGNDGKFSWSGSAVTYLVGGGVDEVRKMTINISAETEITSTI